MRNMLLILKALSDRNRLRMAAALMAFEELCACQIIELLQIKGATVSRHLSQLVQAGILENRKEGRWIYYRMNRSNEIILPVLHWIEKELKHDEDLVNDRRTLESIMACDPEEICRRQRGEACCPRK
ncbi:MAG: ArsR family transcriptional regulator [Desulfobacteraceae bacterium]|nr:MAG: ArsR family transcriptional regulator [Desulfobacteraceae bacterium]